MPVSLAYSPELIAAKLFGAEQRILLFGASGIGKSTLVLQALEGIAAQGHTALYVSAEESAAQIRGRATRLGLRAEAVHLLPEVELETVLAEIERLAEEVRTTQQRYQQLFDSVPIQIVVVDPHLRITAINRRFTEDFGRPVGQNFFDVLRPGRFPAFRDPITQSLKDGMPHQGELVLTDRNGVQYNMMAGTAPIKTLAGKLIQILITFTDVTRLRQLQDNLSSLGMMIGTISHDLKGCLTGLDAGLYLIDTGFYRDRPGRIEEGLEVAKLMVERVRKQVQNILFYTKERQLEIQQTNIEQFATDVAANVDQRIRGANITFHCEFEPDLGEIDFDPDLVRSTLINILENAVEACINDPDTAKAHAIDFRIYPDQDHIVFEIGDNGIGMDEEIKSKIFTPFYISQKQSGTGLGLFIASQILEKNNGRITVTSRPGHGSLFSIRLPGKVIE